MVPDRIEREIVIDAPVQVVWAVVTEPGHIGNWFGDSATIDLRPGGEASLTWDEHGTAPRGSRGSNPRTRSPSAGPAPAAPSQKPATPPSWSSP